MIKRISIRLISVGRMTHFAGKCFLFNPHLKRMKVGLSPKLHDPEAVVQRCSVKQVFLEISQISQENICCQTQACNFIKKETLAQVFSCEIREIYKNTFFIEHLWWLLLDFISKIEGWCHTEFFDLITSNYRQIYLHNFCVLCNYRDIHTQKQLEI